MSLAILFAAVSFAGVAAQGTSDEWQQRLHAVVLEAGREWTDGQRAEAERRLRLVISDHSTRTPNRMEEALKSLRGLILQVEPESAHFLKVSSARFKEECPYPEALAREEFEAGLDLVTARVSLGLSRPQPRDEELNVIRAQLESLYEQCERICLARVTDAQTREEVLEQIRVSRGMETRCVGRTFTLGIDRPLTREEIARTLRTVEDEADTLKGFVLGPEPPSGDGDSVEEIAESVVRRQEWGARRAIIVDAAVSPGKASKLVYPESVFAALQRLEDARSAFRRWTRDACEAYNKKYGNRRDAILKQHEEDARKRLREHRAPTPHPAPPPPPPEIQRRAEPRAPPAQPARSLTPALIVALLTLTAIILVLAAWLRKRQ